MFFQHFSLTAHPFAEKPPVQWLQRDPACNRPWPGSSSSNSRAKSPDPRSNRRGASLPCSGSLSTSLPKTRYQPLYLHLTPIGANGFLRLNPHPAR